MQAKEFGRKAVVVTEATASQELSKSIVEFMKACEHQWMVQSTVNTRPTTNPEPTQTWRNFQLTYEDIVGYWKGATSVGL